jgi:phosphatidylglycerol:prolipoprotein diacylglycerol transferase
MIAYPAINPVAFHIFSWPVYWYGLMYLVGFLAGWGLLSLRTRISPRGFSQEQISDIAFYTALGAIIGGRLGYMLFYDWQVLISNPLLLFQTWKGGMSFHGGLLGVLVAMVIFSKRMHKPFLALTDFVAPVVPIGLGAGRIGNFINGELWGRVTDVPWGMVFPNAPGSLPRHPSQLYEFAMEGVLLFLILFIYSWKPRPMGAVSGLFAIFYGIFRCVAEFFREPDAQIGYLFGGMTEGQLLSLPLILVGIILLVYSYKKGKIADEAIS